ncbi:MAG: hypothetical protein ABSD49_15220 [Candidatus Bathyarchaeia archaeon]|jgi:hypothetical protein
MKGFKWIRVTNETHGKLLDLGRKGQSFDAIINSLVDARMGDI